MAKILLVEDDNNLREIYEARLQAEGYTIVSARDGEEALVVAKAEKPDLVISDVMMPKISGFEMLDIMRNTDGLKDVKVIMLTALGQTEDQQRADKLGADRYLVKSQVTLEDIVKTAHDLLGDEASATASPQPAGDDAATEDDKLMNDAVDSLVAGADSKKPEGPAAPKEEPKKDEADSGTDDSEQVPVARKKVIQPIERNEKDINTLLAEEEAKEAAPKAAPAEPATPPSPTPTPATPDAATTASEEATMDAKIENFVAGASTDATPPATPPASPAPAPPVQPAPQVPSAAQPQPQTQQPQQPPANPPKDSSSPDPNVIAL